jgi:hypothetical protein
MLYKVIPQTIRDNTLYAIIFSYKSRFANLTRRAVGPWLFTSVDELHTSTLQDFVLWALNSSDPSVVALAMLCIAISLQHLDSRVHQYIIRKLPRLPGEIFQDYFENVDRLVLNDPDCASTGAGIEATILSATIHSKHFSTRI